MKPIWSIRNKIVKQKFLNMIKQELDKSNNCVNQYALIHINECIRLIERKINESSYLSDEDKTSLVEKAGNARNIVFKKFSNVESEYNDKINRLWQELDKLRKSEYGCENNFAELQNKLKNIKSEIEENVLEKPKNELTYSCNNLDRAITELRDIYFKRGKLKLEQFMDK